MLLYVPDRWEETDESTRLVTLCHERVHLRQRRRYGDIVMTFLYLVPFFPLGLAYGRARLEWEAYTETLRATAACLRKGRGMLAQLCGATSSASSPAEPTAGCGPSKRSLNAGTTQRWPNST